MVVVAYGCLLPQAVLDIPRHGCINLHPSLLPLWRGATPIQCALLHGETVTGVTVIQMEKGMDSGPILFQSTHDIPNEATSESLHEDLATHGAQAIIDTIHTITTGDCQGIQQIDTQATYCKKIHKQDAVIDWQRSAHDIHCQVRAYNPWPVASTTFNDTLFTNLENQRYPQTIKQNPANYCYQQGHTGYKQAEVRYVYTQSNNLGKALPTHAFIQSNQDSLTPFKHNLATSDVVILDRDGVINEDSPNYIKHPDEWHAIPGSLEIIARWKQQGHVVCVATNQSGIARQYYDL